MSLNQRFRRLTELFVQGKAVKMPDGSHLFVQVINAFERDEAINDAQIARSRMILALKENGQERIKVEGRLAELGKEPMARDLAEARAEGKTGDYAEEMRVDPEWKERMDIALRTDAEQAAKPFTEEEQNLLAKINQEIVIEFAKREKDEADFLERKYLRMSDDDLIDEWVEAWLDKRGAELATAEFRLVEVWYATRYCEATAGEDGELDHSRCDGHRHRVFDNKAEARSAPDALQQLLRDALDEVNLAGRDPKDSDSPENSSASSPPPNEPAESTPSTSTETPKTAPGTSPTPSTTP